MIGFSPIASQSIASVILIDEEVILVQKELSLLWSINQSVIDVLDIHWDVLQSVGLNLDCRYAIAQSVSADISLLFNQYTSLAKELSLKWNSISVTSSDITFYWQLGDEVLPPISIIKIRPETRVFRAVIH